MARSGSRGSGLYKCLLLQARAQQSDLEGRTLRRYQEQSQAASGQDVHTSGHCLPDPRRPQERNQ